MVLVEILSYVWLLFKKKIEEKVKYFWKIGVGELMFCGLRLKNIVFRVIVFWMKNKRRVFVNL